MRDWHTVLAQWGEDHLLGKVVRSSSVLFSSNSIGLVLTFVQSILAARLLGPAGFGLIGVVMSYAGTVNGLFSFRMSELIVRYGGEYLEKGDNEKAASLVKAAGLAEALVSLAAFLMVAASAGLASTYIAKIPNTAWMFVLFSLAPLANFNTETSLGVLQTLDKIRLQGLINVIQSVLTAGMIAFAFFTHGSLEFVLFAYLTGKIVLGLGMFVTAFYHLSRRLGAGWWRASISGLPRFRELARFAVSSNLSVTALLVFRDSEILWVGYFLNLEAAGLYRVVYALANLLSVPANPFILTTYPEINRLIVQKAWARLRNFLRRITAVAAAYNLGLAAGYVLLGQWILSIYGAKYMPAYPALLILLVGLVFNYILFWNRPLLLSLGLPVFPLAAVLAAGLLKTALAFILVPRFGYAAEAALLSMYYIVSVGAIVWRGIREINLQADSQTAPESVT